MSLVVTRFLLILFSCYCGWFIALKGFRSIEAAIIGSLLGLLYALIAVFLDVRIRKMPLKTIIFGAIGTVIGLIIANLFAYSFLSYQLDRTYPNFLIYLSINGFFGYLGLAIGAKKGEDLDITNWPFLGKKASGAATLKILDTSVIIDGRIADIWDTGFLEGAIVLPQFVLRELAGIADSSDSIKRTRGRRGLDIINKLQKQSDISIKIVDQDFPKIQNVDDKIVALAKHMDAAIITNDYNLNQIAEIQGITVLNINQLATAIKPLVLPGESLTVLIQREGKEPRQGVGNLEDGTPVIVENGRKYMGKKMSVSVTSVLQTTAGRMIFTEIK